MSGRRCNSCRRDFYNREEDVPCERKEGICWITKRKPDDPQIPMTSPPSVQFVIDGWEKVTAISPLQRLEKKEGKKHLIIFRPTLDKLDLYMNLIDWKTAPIDRFTFFEWVTLFHGLMTK